MQSEFKFLSAEVAAQILESIRGLHSWVCKVFWGYYVVLVG